MVKWTRPEDKLPAFGQDTLIITMMGEMYVSMFEKRVLYGNDTKPYGWRGPGPFSFFGDSVLWWSPLPDRPKES